MYTHKKLKNLFRSFKFFFALNVCATWYTVKNGIKNFCPLVLYISRHWETLILLLFIFPHSSVSYGNNLLQQKIMLTGIVWCLLLM